MSAQPIQCDMSSPAHFSLPDILATFPDAAPTLLLDRYLVDHATASARVFRMYRPAPAHFHRLSDEYLYVLSGRGTLWVGTPENKFPFAPGTFVFFPRDTPHATPVLEELPVIFLAVDTPRRHRDDVHFLDPAQGTPEDFIREASQSS